MGTLRRSAVAGATACLFLALGGAGCSERIQAPDPRSTPVRNSPAGALRLLEWSYDNRTLAPYDQLLSADFRWLCGTLDTAGAEWRGTTWTREDELGFASHLFFGGNADQPGALSVQLDLDRNFFVYPDLNYAAWDPEGRWHRSIRSSVWLRVVRKSGGDIEFLSHASFHFVRGDSALITEEMRARGFARDSASWYLRRWEEGTAQPGEPPSAPITSWCELKALYR